VYIPQRPQPQGAYSVYARQVGAFSVYASDKCGAYTQPGGAFTDYTTRVRTKRFLRNL